MTDHSAKELLAWRKYPEPDGTSYYAEHLQTDAQIVSLFDYCQILEAYITAQGWKFLFDRFGSKKLFQLAIQSAWFDEEDGEDFLIYHSLISGYDPETDRFGVYSEATGTFTPSKDGS